MVGPPCILDNRQEKAEFCLTMRKKTSRVQSVTFKPVLTTVDIWDTNSIKSSIDD